MAALLPLVSAYDPQIESNKHGAYVVDIGPANFTPLQQNSASLDQSALRFVLNPPQGTFLSPYVVIELAMNFSASATTTLIPPGQAVLNYGSTDALRSWPLASITSVLSTTFNGANITYNMSDFIHEIMRYQHNKGSLKSSSSPIELDNSQQYSDVHGSLFNPLGGYASSTPDRPMRGCFKVVSSLTRVDGALTYNDIQVKFWEYIPVAPFLYAGPPRTQALYGVQELVLNFNFANSLTRAWSHCVGAGNVALNSFAASFSAPTGSALPAITSAICRYEVMKPNVVQELGMKNIYQYYDRNRSFTDGTAIAYGASSTIQSANYQIAAIPERMYLFVKKQPGSLTYADTDSYYRIDQIQISLGSESTLLSGASIDQLYKFSADNGIIDKFDEFRDRVGSVLCLEFGSQIQLPVTYAPGVTVQDQIQAKVWFTNIDATGGKDAAVPTLCMVLETGGILTLDWGVGATNVGGVDRAQVLEAKKVASNTYKEVSQIAGGFNFGKLIKSATPVARTIASVINSLADVGDSAFGSGGAHLGGAHLGGAHLGGGLAVEAAGGKRMSKKELLAITAHR